jgi:hypothetical protein
MQRRSVIPLALAATGILPTLWLTGAAQAQPVARPASNIAPPDTRSVIASALLVPPVPSADPPFAFLSAARRAVAGGRTGEAQEALERAEPGCSIETCRPLPPPFRTISGRCWRSAPRAVHWRRMTGGPPSPRSTAPLRWPAGPNRRSPRRRPYQDWLRPSPLLRRLPRRSRSSRAPCYRDTGRCMGRVTFGSRPKPHCVAFSRPRSCPEPTFGATARMCACRRTTRTDHGDREPRLRRRTRRSRCRA